MKLFVAPLTAPPNATAVAAAPLRGDLARVFGAPPPDEAPAAAVPPPQAARFQLIGVAAPRAGTRGPGVALIAIDGKPARPYRVGAIIDGDWHLQTIAARSVSLGPQGGGAAVTLELPALPLPATGTLPPAGAAPAGPAPGMLMAPQQPIVVPQQPMMVPPPPLPGGLPTLPTS